MASLHYQRLLDRAGVEHLSPLTLFNAALAAERSGDALGSERAWVLFSEKARNGLDFNGKRLSLDEVQRELVAPRRSA